jgi:hypothetical protein
VDATVKPGDRPPAGVWTGVLETARSFAMGVTSRYIEICASNAKNVTKFAEIAKKCSLYYFLCN